MIQNIIDDLKIQDITLDKGQLNLIENLVEQYNIEKNFFDNLIKKQKKRGAYIWGDVGRGKTLIIKSFLKEIPKKTSSFHYIDLMHDIHNQLKDLSSNKDPINIIAKNYYSKFKVIFIDEFQVEDVADAMIIGNLLNQLIINGVELYLTSNASPDNLYKDGLQRQKFMKAMNFLKSSLNIYELRGVMDYRTRNIHQFSEVDSNPYLKMSNSEIKDFLIKNFSEFEVSFDDFPIKSRKFKCKAYSNNFLWVSYKDFFIQPTGSKDFIEICKNIDWIFINDFHEYDDNHADIIRRFISFIDICYIENTKVKFFIDSKSIENLYKGTKLNILWNRCASRLKEMQTIEYLESSK
ncbi:cell division protein ZapE [Gammaproteobacteria bacterium]|nr:cell division protein ZapE [Gammaproteobacteria bacterium]